MRSFILLIFTVFLSTVSSARDFKYKGVWYTIVDEVARTCETKSGRGYPDWIPGNEFIGDLEIPLSTYDGDIEYTVVSIGANSFVCCYGLTSVSIPPSVVSVGENAFRCCDNLSTICFPESLVSIGYYTFGYCRSLTEITLPESLTSIGEAAFYGCSSLSKVIFSENLRSIGRVAFGYCTSLSSVSLPKSVSSLESNPFVGCSNLKSIIVDRNNPFFTSIDGIMFNNDLTKLIAYPSGLIGGYSIPSSVTVIGGYAFSGCKYMKNVSFPENLISIDDYAFEECGLSSISLPENLITIGDYAFFNCTSLTSVEFPESLTSIGIAAFCLTRLPSVSFPKNLTSIGSRAFLSCYEIKWISFSEGLISIGEKAFLGCEGVRSLSFPESLKYIDDYAFQDCCGLKSISFPKDIQSIGNGAFKNCSGLSLINYYAENLIEASENIFETNYESLYDKVTLHVLESAANQVGNTIPWCLFKNRVADLSKVSTIIFDNSDPIEIFTLDGVKLNTLPDTLPSGIYIIRNGNKSVKAVVK